MSAKLEPTKNEMGFLFAMAMATGHQDGFDEATTRRVLRVMRDYRAAGQRERKTEWDRTNRSKAKGA